MKTAAKVPITSPGRRSGKSRVHGLGIITQDGASDCLWQKIRKTKHEIRKKAFGDHSSMPDYGYDYDNDNRFADNDNDPNTNTGF